MCAPQVWSGRALHSQRIRIPKLLLDQAGLGEEVEMEMQDNQIVIRRSRHARHNWQGQFRANAERGDDKLLDSDAPALTTWDEEKWEWQPEV